MTDREVEKRELDEEIIIDDVFVKEYSSNKTLIKFIQDKFKRLSRLGAINIIKFILERKSQIHASEIVEKWKSFYHYNMGNFDEKKNLKPDVIKNLRISINGCLAEIGKEIVRYDEDKHRGFDVEKINDIDFYILDKNSSYKKVRKLTCDEGGDVMFKYDFNNPDMSLKIPSNEETLQRCQIQILSKGIKFDYPIEFEYRCPQCGNVTTMKAYETASTNNRIKCPGIFNYINAEGEPRSRVCNNSLNPDSEISLTKDAYYYDIIYEDENGSKHSVGALSFNTYEPGYYECVLFKIKNPKKTELYQIIDVKEIFSNKFEFPNKKDGENYVFTLQRAFDKFIKNQTGMEIYGLYPIKISLLLQKTISKLNLPLIGNIQIVGDASTGKSTILKYYGFLLNRHFYLSTNGLSISVAGLRGTKQTINLMGKDVKIITTGYLGTFTGIHIDEAGENKELVQNLKTFLLEDNYGYNKAEATGSVNVRIAQVNISENLDYTHLGQYRGAIRKTYKDYNIKIGIEEKEPWDENWDLHLPLHKYTNPYLRKIIKDKRTEYKLKQLFWINAQDIALTERFPFFFYLVNEKQDDKFVEIIKGNTARNKISENLQLIKVLKSNDIETFFSDLKKYEDSPEDLKSFDKVDDIIKEYGINADARTKIFYYTVVKLSRILNKRKKVEEMDFDLLKWLIEKIGSKIDIVETVDYKINGPPDLETERKIDEKIEDDSKVIENDEFGLPDSEFD